MDDLFFNVQTLFGNKCTREVNLFLFVHFYVGWILSICVVFIAGWVHIREGVYIRVPS